MKKRNCIIGQSGGPTIAINASLAGIIHKAKSTAEYENVYGMINGIKGLLEGRYMDLLKEFDTGEKINALKDKRDVYEQISYYLIESAKIIEILALCF